MTENNDVRTMLRDRAAAIEPADGWERIVAGVRREQVIRRRQRFLAAAAVLALVAGAVGVYAATRDEDRPTVIAGPTPDNSESTDASAAQSEVQAPSADIADRDSQALREDHAVSTCSGGTVTDAMVRQVGSGGAERLPARVADRRSKIIAAARACDYDAVAALASRSGFQFSYGDGKDASAYWRNAEADGEPVMRMLVLTLYLEPGVREVSETEGPATSGASRSYIWPAAASVQEPSSAQWEDLLKIYGDDQVAAWEAEGNFTGYRVGIDSDGDWTFFVAGD